MKEEDDSSCVWAPSHRLVTPRNKSRKLANLGTLFLSTSPSPPLPLLATPPRPLPLLPGYCKLSHSPFISGWTETSGARNKNASEDQALPLTLMPDKAVLWYICSRSHRLTHVYSLYILNSIPHAHPFQTWQLAFCLTKDNLCIISAKSRESCLKLSLSTILPWEKIPAFTILYNVKLLYNEVLLWIALKLEHHSHFLYARCLWYPEAIMHLRKEYSMKASSTPASLWHQC